MKSRNHTTPFITTTLLAAGLTLATPYALADNDELAAALVLGGTGAVFGNAIGGTDGAVVGGFLGAILGASIADDNDRHYSRRYDNDYRRGREPVYVVAPPPRYRWHDEWRHQDERRWNDRRWRDDDWRHDRGRDGNWDRRR